MEIIIEGIVSIANGEHPAITKEKLLAFLAPALREKKIIRLHSGTIEIKFHPSVFLLYFFSEILGTMGSVSAYPSALNLLGLNLPFSRIYLRTAAALAVDSSQAEEYFVFFCFPVISMASNCHHPVIFF